MNDGFRADTPLLFVTVGTDHHPFDRLMRWVDGWLEANPRRFRCMVQSGSSVTPRSADHVGYVGVHEMESFVSAADALVCHGGPGTIAISRRLGIRPIVVPRSPEFGEHVDGHQIAFARRLAAAGDISIAETHETFDRLVSMAADDPTCMRVPGGDEGADAVLRRFAALVDPLLTRRFRPGGPAETPSAES